MPVFYDKDRVLKFASNLGATKVHKEQIEALPTKIHTNHRQLISRYSVNEILREADANRKFSDYDIRLLEDTTPMYHVPQKY